MNTEVLEAMSQGLRGHVAGEGFGTITQFRTGGYKHVQKDGKPAVVKQVIAHIVMDNEKQFDLPIGDIELLERINHA